MSTDSSLATERKMRHISAIARMAGHPETPGHIALCQDIWATAFLRTFREICLQLDYPVPTSLNLSTIIFLCSKIVNLASNPQPGGPGLYIYVLQWQACPVMLPDTPGSLLVAFCDSQSYSGGVLTRLHTGCLTKQIWRKFKIATWPRILCAKAERKMSSGTTGGTI
jgi:hypothetical protein